MRTKKRKYPKPARKIRTTRATALTLKRLIALENLRRDDYAHTIAATWDGALIRLLSPGLFVHVWDERMRHPSSLNGHLFRPQLTPPIHNHTCGVMESTVLAGRLRHITFDLEEDPEGAFQMWIRTNILATGTGALSYALKRSGKRYQVKVRTDQEIKEGRSYRLRGHRFHLVFALEPGTVTFVRKTFIPAGRQDPFGLLTPRGRGVPGRRMIVRELVDRLESESLHRTRPAVKDAIARLRDLVGQFEPTNLFDPGLSVEEKLQRIELPPSTKRLVEIEIAERERQIDEAEKSATKLLGEATVERMEKT